MDGPCYGFLWNTEKMQCAVDYHFTNTDYSELKALTDNQYERLVEAKEVRLAATFENQYLEQCNSLPIDGFDRARHGAHLNPCYKKFTKIMSVCTWQRVQRR